MKVYKVRLDMCEPEEFERFEKEYNISIVDITKFLVQQCEEENRKYCGEIAQIVYAKNRKDLEKFILNEYDDLSDYKIEEVEL